MLFDSERMMYVLTETDVQNELSINLAETTGGSDSEIENYLLGISKTIYAFIMGYKFPRDRAIWEYIYSDLKYAKIFKEILIDQVKYAYMSGGDNIGYEHGVDVYSGRQMDIHNLRDRSKMVSSTTMDLMASYELLVPDLPYELIR